MKDSTIYDTEIDYNNKNIVYGKEIELIGSNKKVLEFGCSTGYVSKILKLRGCTITGIEIDDNAAGKARDYCEKVIIADIETIELNKQLGGEKFDVALFGDILEHLKDPKRILLQTKDFLSKDGYIVVSIPNIANWSIRLELLIGKFDYQKLGLLDDSHLRFFTKKSIMNLLESCGYFINSVDFTKLEVDWIKVNSTLKLKGLDGIDVSKIFTMFNDSDAEAYQYVIKASVCSEYKYIEKLSAEKILLEQEIREKNISIAEKDKQISGLSETIQSKDKQISELGETIQSKDKYIHKLETTIAEKDKKLNDIYISITWRVLTKYQRFINIILPLNTKRRRAYDNVIVGIRTIANNGFGAFLFKSKDRAVNSGYDLWILRNESARAKVKQYKKEIIGFECHPKISIITPVYNPDIKWVKAAIESVVNQVYGNWELCIADASTKEDVKKYLKNCAKKDSRIKVKFLPQNKGIAGNSNEALVLATGEYIGLLDHDDQLSPDALYEVVRSLQKNRDADMIYSDEDKVDLKGNRSDPFFKPDWSPYMFMSFNYLCHFSVIRKVLIDELGGFRDGYDGSQDYDLFLRVTELSNRIIHIPKILYHWRTVTGSTAGSSSGKSYSLIASKNALKSAIVRRKLNAEVIEGLFPNSYRIKYSIIGNPKVCIIIPTKDKVNYLKPCISSILNKTDYSNIEIIILDTGSKENSTNEFYDEIKNNNKIRIVNYPKNEFNFAEANTWAAKTAAGEYLLFLNNDTEVINKDWLTSMMEYAIIENIGIVGSKLLYPDNTIQHMGVVIGLRGGASHAGVLYPEWQLMGHPFLHAKDVIRDVSAVTGACLLIKKELFCKVGGFDKRFKIAFNDIDLCLKVLALKYHIVYTPYAKLIHHESISFGRPYEHPDRSNELFEEERNLFREKWNLDNFEDPYYNKNLTLKDESLSLKI